MITQWSKDPLVTANTAKDGTGTVALIYKAEQSAIVKSIHFRSLGTNVASVGRIFINNGHETTNANNNSLLMEIPLPATTLSETDAQEQQTIIADLEVKAGYRLYATIGTSVAAGWQVTVI